MNVSRICHGAVDLVDLNESAWAAAERMLQRAVGALVVLNRDREPIGIVTSRDLVINVLATERQPRTTRVRDIMTSPVKTILNSSSIPSALALMRRSEVRRLPVVDTGGKLVGILTLSDVLSHLAQQPGDVGRLLQQPSTRAEASPPGKQ